ncbi:protein SUPPRESSOR OF npr1-1, CONSTITUTIVE 1-like isoform X3 [Vigna unguiculata]|uniref:protein SUPPRESSOR OF npr1-1, CONSTITUTIVE 1-like isoform X3 n=1 Tax=Vigna unguiculata TaxID=3917 RepID=UPI00101643AA|nr:protein SUPPRESSOR OF npr1-1, CONSTITUTIVE 1-like isoform X3 [Vigna unguiculata]
MEFATSSSKLPRKYDVLISFNGDDIRRKFVSHLDSALSAVGLTTLLHYENAVKSTHIQQPILNLCRVVIVVFTKTYSQSAWCLHQLQQIIQWHQTYCRHVLPVYYEIQPSHVRIQQGDFGMAFKTTAQQTFSEHELEHGLSSWSHALTKAANFFGWDESNHRSDAELVDKIVKSVLNLSALSATKFPVGLQDPVELLLQAINNKSMDVCTIGVCGMGGSGKTTLAKAIYHQIHGTFMQKSFIEDIAQVSKPRGRIHLQQQLLSDVLKTKVEIHSVEMGRSMIRERLFRKRVLIVLDDMDDYLPLLDLRNSRSWLSEGTVIIITTRDRHLLRKHQVDFVFEMNLLNENESLELLSWHAFREAKPKEEYHDLAKAIVTHCGGLPLALEVIGSTLFESTEEEWQTVLFELEEIPMDDVQLKLKISLDRLHSQMEKDLFLDVCCYFVGKDRAYATKILNGSGVDADNEIRTQHGYIVDADTGIRVLMERNLIKVKSNNKFGMHPLLQEMGIGFFREISGEKRLKNSQLLFDVDVEYALKVNSGRKSFEVLPVKLLSTRREISRQTKDALNSEYLPPKLRWITLHGFSSQYLPNGFNVQDAIAIDLKHSLLRFFWEEPQVLRSLKVLNLSHSMYLTETPDFSRLPSLEQLILKDCPRLRIVHSSIGDLCYLILLNLKDCQCLSNLPREIYKLKSLRTLILSGCSKICRMEKDILRMKSLITLIAENTAAKQVPFSIVSSKAIGYISLRGFERLSCNLFPSIIIRSWMSHIINPISYVHSLCMDIDNSWDDIVPLLGSLTNLRSVLVQCDTEFQLSKQVQNILVEYFSNITESGISMQQFRCSLIGVGAYHEFFNVVSDNISEVLAGGECCDASLQCDNHSYWLAYIGEGDSVSFTMPPHHDVKGMILCVIYLSIPEIVATEGLRSVLIVNYTKCTLHVHMHGTIICFNDIDWEGIKSNLRSGDKVEIFVTFGHGLVVKNTRLYLICGESNYLETKPRLKKNLVIRFIKKVVE